MQNMYHLLDREQLELDGFNPFSPSADEAGRAGAEAVPAAAAAPAAAPAAGGAVLSNGDVKKDVGGGVAAIRAKVEAKVGKGGVKRKVTAAKAVTKGKGKGGGGGEQGGGNRGVGGGVEAVDEEEMRRLGIYAAFLLPLANSMCADQKRAAKNVSRGL